LHLDKSFDVSIKAFSKFVMKKNNWKYIIIGQGPEKKMLKSLIKKLSLSKKVIIKRPNNNLDKIYTQSFALLQPSTSEGMSNVALDALSYQIPIITTKHNSIIKNNYNGLIFNNNNFNQLSELMLLLSNNQKLYKKIKLNQKKEIKKYSFNKIISKWENIFNKYLLK